MIHIDISDFRVSLKWRRRVKEHLRKMHKFYNACDEKGLKKYINDNSKHLSIVKRQLSKWSNDKCWYSEGRSDIFHLRVDHFRPKNEIALIKAKDTYVEARTFDTSMGYWWLAFDWKNFRLTGEIVNSYKGSYFPVERGSMLASQPSHNHKNERNIFLDPTVQLDTELITYTIDGLPAPAVSNSTDPWNFFRADLSIRLFGLKDSVLVNSRKIVLSNCNRLIDKAEKYWLDWNSDLENSILQRHFAEVCSELIAMTRRDQPFSSLTKSRIKLLPNSCSWAHQYVIPMI